MKRLPEDMSKETIDMVMQRIDEAGIRQVVLNTIGETLLAPHLEYALRESKKRQLFVLVSTNGQNLSEENVRILLEGQCDILRISVNAISPEKYGLLHEGGSFEQLLGNLERLKAKRDAGFLHTAIRVRCVLPPHGGKESGEESKEELAAFWGPYADETEFVTFGNMGGRNGAPPVADEDRVGCITMKRGLNITANGGVTYCPCDFDAECVVGNIYHASLAAIWQGEAFSQIRALHDACDFRSLPKCAFCDATRRGWYKKKFPKVCEQEATIMDAYFTGWREQL